MGSGGGGDTNPKPDPWLAIPANTNQNPMPTGGANALLTPALQYAQAYMQSQLQGLPQVNSTNQAQPNQQQINAFLQRMGASQSGKAAVTNSIIGQVAGQLSGQTGAK